MLIVPDIGSSTCRACPYHPESRETPEARRVPAPRTGRQHVPLRAEVNGSKTLLLLQTPGIDEWDDGRPLSSGKKGAACLRFKAALKDAGRRREEFDIAEAVNCYPGQDEKQRDRRPPTGAIKACSRWLQPLARESHQGKTV